MAGNAFCVVAEEFRLVLPPKMRMKGALAHAHAALNATVMILPAFLARVKPVSTMAKPACIKNTSIAAITVHTASIALKFSAGNFTRLSAIRMAPSFPYVLLNASIGNPFFITKKWRQLNNSAIPIDNVMKKQTDTA